MMIGALDVGTNTVLMLVAEKAPDGSLRRVLDLSRITRLGKGVDSNHRLDPQAADRTLDAIAEFAEQARAAGAERIVTAATAALRDAADGPDFIGQVRERTGVELEIISGEAEAWLSYLAVLNGLKLDPIRKLLIIDIGGGSTEFINVTPGARLRMISLQIGSVRLTERIIHDDPPTPREATDLRLAIDEQLDGVPFELSPEDLVGIAGTVTTVCAVALGMETYDPARIHSYRLSRDEVERVLKLFGSMPLGERRKLKGLPAERADVIFAGTAILERVMSKADVQSVLVSDQGVRWGLAWRELGSEAKPSARA
jgi:exopolyphosphatase / guanosine-5'-triphosphate,3'-diphosphate pyrophosphatase